MNRTTYLLLKIAEEAAEVAQMASKTAQFGTSERYEDGPSNLDRLSDELCQLTTVCAMLAQRQRDVKGEAFDFGNTVNVPQYDKAKQARVDYYYDVALFNQDTMDPAPEPFDAVAWAAENLDTWRPMCAGEIDGVRWETVAEHEWGRPAGFLVIDPSGPAPCRVSLTAWTAARRSLGRDALVKDV